MSEYLSKEEIRKWRSSLERITLEEYAARLGKVIQEEKHDDSLVDSVMFRSLNSMSVDKYTPKTEKIQTLAIKSFNREKEIVEKKEVKPAVKKVEAEKKVAPTPAKKKETTKEVAVKEAIDNINFSFKKALTSFSCSLRACSFRKRSCSASITRRSSMRISCQRWKSFG